MRTTHQLLDFAVTNVAYREARGNLHYRAIDALGYVRDPGPSVDMEQYTCAHQWAYTGTAYGGDDTSYFGEGRCYCLRCGIDGDV
ncbi:hypothetical protein LMG22037_05532 [Paraburkholderia phenoliruptrix]|jgi:hypothetical protein|uniref:Uncharacterized protein n=1 Tax=Paraburkholderia phenoliruptrix TaxID=252970 RepID=A0A6J5CBL7_9BURK|nr:hypothetical protein [Paraburkholderia phenoliruptrix]CAB3730447.1 hypothetical protein LMG22037_05532 [Paraburkholderia phenoliruptrix]